MIMAHVPAEPLANAKNRAVQLAFIPHPYFFAACQKRNTASAAVVAANQGGPFQQAPKQVAANHPEMKE